MSRSNLLSLKFFATDVDGFLANYDVYDEGSLVMGGRRVKVRKPRARSVDGQELPLPHWERFKATDPLEERAVEQILCGVTTRKYERSLERLDDGRASSGTSRSSVSRRFVARTARQVQQ